MTYQVPVRNWSKLRREKQAEWLIKARLIVYATALPEQSAITGAKELRVYQLATRLYYSHARGTANAE